MIDTTKLLLEKYQTQNRQLHEMLDKATKQMVLAADWIALVKEELGVDSTMEVIPAIQKLKGTYVDALEIAPLIVGPDTIVNG